MKKKLKKIYYMLFQKYYFSALKDYEFTDEKLKYVHILEAINYCKVALMPQVYFEFGCHSGRTFSAAIRASTFLNLSDFKFYAFDSFEGLPETNEKIDGYFKTGTYKTVISDFKKKVLENSGVEIDEQYLIKGFYSASLTKELQSSLPKIGVIHIDVDLYSSTVEVLQFIKPLLVVGSVILFDDYYCFPPNGEKGEMRAFNEFLVENPEFVCKEWKAYSTFGQSFFVTKIS
jgi:O-methyltransferase